MDVIELANHLRLEHLFISTDKQQLQKLNEQVGRKPSRKVIVKQNNLTKPTLSFSLSLCAKPATQVHRGCISYLVD